ncbi:MAG: Ribosomal RNA small subunit methyltransferase I [Acidimicrobiales bacterium]|nr:MAG: 16S rRNA (cytidine(1402)-2'-O)-methyltransferase [Actinomycetota bacterium]MBV6507797.1 Ribosomal RNA small subunit methyltransferase I [Acidimicrobiales bacterium]RIK05955.1 MAG: 16S rRNA (cytidine(1402)-2'-O)-methyltransferase [Acidobacteriota bacterium]
MTGAGELVIVATPIGNLDDLSPRAAEALRTADAVACEDTRRTGRLLVHVGADAPVYVVVNEYSESSAITEIAGRIEAGETVVLVSDSGTPAVSDPGEVLVGALLDRGLPVRVVPGPSAVLAALVPSGLSVSRFCFEGFLPRKGAARSRRLEALADEERTIVLFEAPHRLRRSLTDLAAALGGDRSIALCRELTKLHEEVWRGSLDAAIALYGEREPRGEYVLVLAGAPGREDPSDTEIRAALQRHVDGGASTRDAAAAVAAELAVSRRRVYQLAVERT